MPGGDRIVQNIEITAVQQRDSIAMSKFETKLVLSLSALEAVQFWFQNGDICDKNSGYEPVISGYILILLDIFPVFFAGLKLKIMRIIPELGMAIYRCRIAISMSYR